MNFTPFKLIGVSKSFIWGGTRLRQKYKKTSSFEKIAESWELTVRPDGMSYISSGEFATTSLEDYLKNNPAALGSDSETERFPLLIKFIDAEDDLSIQVHPDDEYAHTHTSDGGKTEMWYVIEADDDACLICGLSDGVTTEHLENSLEYGNIENCLNKVKISKGEVYFIPSGQIHAICHGAFIAEIQQNSNVTYRVYDYNRCDANGKKRSLHIKEALDTVRAYSADEVNKLQFASRKSRRKAFDGFDVICDCKFFRVSKKTLHNGESISFTVDEKSFVSLLFTDADNATVITDNCIIDILPGDSIFVPAATGEVKITGCATVLLSEI